jgi:hypothetical protein
MLFELRRYEAQPGRRAELVEIMDNEVIPFQAGQGMSILGSFVDEENPDVYVWIRRFDDEEARKALYAKVYESDHWKQNLAPRFPEIMRRESIQVTRLNPTRSSILR